MQGDPVGFWLGRVAPCSRQGYLSGLNRFLFWVQRQEGWQGVDARMLLQRQVESQDRYVVLDLLQKYVSELDLTLNGKKGIYVAVRSFFMHNRCELPTDGSFRVRASKPPIMAKLTLGNVADMVKAAGLRDRSIILVKWQSMQDSERLCYLGVKCAEQIVSQIRAETHPVRINLPDRKNNNKPFYTFIGKDSITALQEYFEKERGWPKPKEPIWIQKRGGQVTTTGFLCVWMGLLRRIGLIPKRKGELGARYGYGSHETRDIAKSLLHTHALKDGFDMECAKFMMGHGTDKYGYDKFYQDQEYVRKQYLIAEPYLNILSQPQPSSEQDQKRIKELEGKLAKVDELERMLLEMKQLVEKSVR